MHISCLLPLTIILGSLAPAGAIPVAEPAVDGIYARNEDIHYRDSSIVARDGPGFWMESVKHQGISPLGPSGYTVFRNVKDFGAKGMHKGPLCHFR
jgi:glucan 1,3-beta-glucosidase